MAGSPERWEWLQAAYRVYQSIGIEDCRLVTPEEAAQLNPLMSTEGLLGGMWADREGYLDTSGTVRAYALAAKSNGAEYYENTKVDSLIQRKDGWEVVTQQQTIRCEHVVNAAGLWAKQVGRMAGIELPLSPLTHHYLISDTIPELEELNFEVPMTVDLEGFTYLRQDQKGVLLGIYEINHEHWAMDGAPWDYGMELFKEQVDRIENEITLGFERYPCLQEVGVKTWVNGAFTFSPDGNPLMGPVPGKNGYWCACAVMAGFLQGGGVGKSLAEWMIYGEPEADVYGMDVARYGKFAENKEYIRQTTGQFYSRRFVMTYPNEQLPAGRPLKMAPAHDAMSDAGCQWGISWDLEVPLYFAEKGFQETPSLKRSNAFSIVSKECLSVRDNVGLLDISGFSRFEVSGPNTEQWLNKIFASKLPKLGKSALAPMLSQTGRLKGDLSVFNWGDGTWWIMGSYYLRAWHMRWFLEHIIDGVNIRDLGEDYCGFSIAGPKSREMISQLCEGGIENLPFMGCGSFDIGLVRSKVGRLSVAGELGYEINCKMGDHVALRRLLIEKGVDFGMIEYGFNALNSMRLEKSFGIWSAEFTQGYTPGMTGLDRWINWNKKDFIGKKQAYSEKSGKGPEQKLVTLEVNATDADASGFEPIWIKKKRVGFVTSGGYGHRVKKSLAMALVDSEYGSDGQEVTVHVVGKEQAAIIIPSSPYAPSGILMRS